MDVAGIGVQTISTTTGTAQNANPAPDRTNDNDRSAENAKRVNPPPAPGTGNIVDKSV